MEIYLVRHTTPAVEKGICYGQSDLDVTESFLEEANIIRQHLPKNITAVYSSPLQRCKKLAAHLFPDHAVQLDAKLMEINCGMWEMKRWDDIPKEEIDPWMEDFLNVRIPGGESYVDLFERVSNSYNRIHQQPKPSVIVAHGGVIRSILSYITNTPLKDSFNVFSLHYGCVVKVIPREKEIFHEILSNIPHEKETHKPSNL
jgi:alpha-ribazole phosphatase